MTRNTQILILIVASQVAWAACCVASIPAFAVPTYDETPMMWAVIINGLFIVAMSSLLMLLAIAVALTRGDDLSPRRLDPKFAIGMGVTVFLLIGQVIVSVTHMVWQPSADEVIAPSLEQVPIFEFRATLDDGSQAGGAYGFVVAHPGDGRPVFVTVSQQFSEADGLESDMSVREIIEHVEHAVAIPVDGGRDDTTGAISLGAPIDFEPDAAFASGYGIEDSQSDVVFFDAPGLESYILAAKVYGDGLQDAPLQQKLFVRSDTMHSAEFSNDGDDVWDIDVTAPHGVVEGSPVLDWEHEVVGFVTLPTQNETEVFPMHLAYDYLGEPLSFR